ncbi:hypothetical protein O9992_24360 [Vibrio lentus]|nr:hypothetical protein [Vibrio lentus]
MFKENRNGELVLDKDSDAYVAVNARRDEAWTKHTLNCQLAIKISKKMHGWTKTAT